MAEQKEDKSFEEWLAEERVRLDKGFSFEPKTTTTSASPSSSSSSVADQALAGLGLGAGVVGGAVAPHPNPTTFEGCTSALIVSALQQEFSAGDTRVQVQQNSDATIVSILQSQDRSTLNFRPAVNVALVEKAELLTVTVSDLSQDTVRDTISSIGGTLLEQGKHVLVGRRRGVGGVLDMAGRLKDGVTELVEDIQDLGLPRRVWAVIDRVGGAAEQAHLDHKREQQKQQWAREEAERAWLYCTSCGRRYREEETARADCPSCGAPRSAKPAWLP
jgi:DNA-directed RNA polymerase subunit RPC12/RpoP